MRIAHLLSLTLACILLGVPTPAGALPATLLTMVRPASGTSSTILTVSGGNPAVGGAQSVLVLPAQIPVSMLDPSCGPTPPPVPTVIIKKNPDVNDVVPGQNVVLMLDIRAAGNNYHISWSVERGWLSDYSMPAVIYRAPDTSGTDTVTVRVSSRHGETVERATFKVGSPTREPRQQALLGVVSIEVPIEGEDAVTGGSGSLIGAAGYILTNFHVVADPDTGEPYNSEGLIRVAVNPHDLKGPALFKYRAVVVAVDRELDLALLRIHATADGNPLPRAPDLVTIPVGDSDTVRHGDELWIIGFPSVGGRTVTLTRGTVAGFLGEEDEGPWIKTDAEINPGNSGGAAVNSAWQLVGIPSRLYYTTRGPSGKLGVVRPVNLARQLLDRIPSPSPMATQVTMATPSGTTTPGAGGLTPPPTYTPNPTYTPYPTYTPQPTYTPAPPPGGWVRKTDGMVMVFVPAGEFLMGSPEGEGDRDEHPQHRVNLDAFWIDQTEVTNDQYRRCLEESICTEPVFWADSAYNQGQQPVIGVDWRQAQIYCRWAGGRLPTEAEWEKAARGTDGRRYPWGNALASCSYAAMYDESGSGCGRGRPWPVGSKPRGASPYGALDMAGNVWEWVADWYAPDFYTRSPERNPSGPDSGDYRVLRGGSWYYSFQQLRTANRHRDDPDDRYDYNGFRCVVTTPP